MSSHRVGAVVGVACAAEFMVVLDASVVNVALPAIRDGLGFGATGLQWVITAYTLVFAGFLLLGGRLADRYGVRRVFAAGLVLFTLASAAGGLAPTAGVLVGARAVQALGAAVLAPASLTLLTTTVGEGPRRVRALAVWTALASAGGAAGSLLGGVLTEYLTWRATLLVNVPLGALALVVAARTLRPDAPPRAGARLDLPGAVAATAGPAALTFAVSGAADRGWGSPTTLGGLAVAVVALGVFAAHETRWAPSPLLPPRLLRNRAVAVGNVAMLLAGAALMPMWYLLSLYQQQVLGLSALRTGLGFLPHTLLTVAVGAWAAPALMRRFPARGLVAAGCLVAAAGFWWQSRVTVADGYLLGVLAPAIPISVGGGLLNTPLTTAVTSGVAGGDAGAASGLMNTTKQVGGAVGLAAVLTAAAGAAGDLADPARFTDGFGLAFALLAGLMVAVAVLAALLPPLGAPAPAPAERHRPAPRT